MSAGGFFVMGLMVLALVVVGAWIMLNWDQISDNQVQVERERTAQEEARALQRFYDVQRVQARNERWLDFSQAMYPWFSTFLIALVVLLVVGLVAFALLQRGQPQQQQPQIIVIASSRREALEVGGEYAEHSDQIVVIDSREERRFLK